MVLLRASGNERKWVLPMIALAMMALMPLGQRDLIYAGDGTTRVVPIDEYARDAAELPSAASLSSLVGAHFLENRGQLGNADVRFYGRSGRLSAGLTPDGAIITMEEPIAGTTSCPGIPRREEMAPLAPRSASFSMMFEGCNRIEPVAHGQLDHPTNFFLGNDPDHWITCTGSFSEVLYEGIYDGVDAKFYFKGGLLKYDLILHYGADMRKVVVRYEGAEDPTIEEASGDLLINTELGAVRDRRPIVYDASNGLAEGMPGTFVLLGGPRIGFALPEGRAWVYPIVIDPGIEASTLLGGSDFDQGSTVVTDPDGNVIVSGNTYSHDFPRTNGTYNLSHPGENFYVAKFDANLTRLIFATYIGGSNFSDCRGLDVGEDGSIYLSGYTTCQDFPMVNGLFDTFRGGYCDLVVLKLSSNGSQLLNSTYFGGDGTDYEAGLEVWKDGSISFAGYTDSHDFPTTQGAFCATYEENRTDGEMFIAKLNGSFKSIDGCSYLGGRNGSEIPGGNMWSTMDIAPSGNIVFSGGTFATDYTVTQGAYCRTAPSGGNNMDLVISVLDPTCSHLLYSTYFGGTLYEMGSVVVGDDGSVFLAGYTSSMDLAVTADAPCKEMRGSLAGFLAILDPTLSTLRYCTYIDGSADDQILAMAWGPGKQVLYMVLWTNSTDLGTTPGCFDSRNRNPNGTVGDLYIMGLNVTDRSVVYATYLGGGGDEGGFHVDKRLIADAQGKLYLTATTMSNDFPTTEGAYSDRFLVSEAFVVKLDPRPCSPPGPPAGLEAVGMDERVFVKWERATATSIFKGCRFSELRLYKGISPQSVSLLANLSGTNVSYEDLNVTNGVRYYYRLTIVTDVGEGTPATATARPMHVPTEPLDLGLGTGNRTMELHWSAPIDVGGELLGYRIYRGDSPTSLIVIATVGNVTAYEDLQVDCRRNYWYSVAAFNEKGEGRRGSTQYAMPQGPPAAPEGLAAQAGDGRVDLSWQAPGNDGGHEVVGYRLYKGSSPQGLARVKQLGKDARSYADMEVVNAQEYWYAVTAYSMFGEGAMVPIRAMPFTLPGRPLDLVAEAGNASANLSWDPPTIDSGRPVTAYKVYYGKSRDSMGLTSIVGNVTGTTVNGLRNGDTYYFKVAAVNEAGEGLASDVASAVPMGPPAPPTDLAVRPAVGGMRLSWMPPVDLGGAKSVSFRIYRIGPEQLPVLVKEVPGSLQYLDGDVKAGSTYSYWVTAITPEGREGGPSNVFEIIAKAAPGALSTLRAAIEVPSGVNLSWDAVDDDGGSPITNYTIYRGLSPSSLERIATVGPVLAFADRDVQNGLVHYYSVRAVNEFGEGPGAPPIDATPLGLPLPPLSLRVAVEGGKVTLSWGPAPEAGRAPIKGFVVYRGVSKGSLKRLDEVGDVRSYTDGLAERGRTYYYSVAALSDLGEGERAVPVSASTPVALGTLLLILLVVVIACAVAVVAVRRRRAIAGAAVRVMPTEGETIVSVEAAATGPPIAATAVDGTKQHPGYVIEEVFVVNRDGRLMADCAREYCRTRDADLMSGLLIAIQGLIQDGLRREDALESMKYGDSRIMIASGPSVHLAVVVYGEPDDELRDALESTVEGIEATYAGVLSEWTGDFSMTAGIEGLAMPLVRRTEHLQRQDVTAPEAPPGVVVLSAVDFHRGYVRLKVAAVNGTEELVADAAIDVHYNPDMLRLERVEPATLKPKGDRVNLGTIKPGERATVAFLFDPQICQGTHIDGVLNYYDTGGVAHHVQMKRRTADVVCPIFFTREHANTAMLRRLIKERLHQSDLRVLHYPATVSPQEALRMAKSALGGEGVQLVREYVTGGPPYEAEAWYYGETKVKGYQMVMRLGVLEDRRVLEFFAASTAMEPITGLLAEFRRQLDRTLHERYGGGAIMQPATDESLLRDLDERELRIETDAQDDTGAAGEGIA